jgi:hypothetical protein
MPTPADDGFKQLVILIAIGDSLRAIALLGSSPELATLRAEHGATRKEAEQYFYREVGHYLNVGDTALHIAAAAYNTDVARALIRYGADVRSRNRLGAEPLHYAADGAPDSIRWNAAAQRSTIAYLIEAGADPNVTDRRGVTPLHRAIRTRCAGAVKALLDGGADSRKPNGNGSTPMVLAERNTGRGGSGSPAAKAQQAQIIQLLEDSVPHQAVAGRDGRRH